MPMNFAQDQSGMDGSFASPAQPAPNRGGKSFGGRGGMPMQSTMRDFLNQAPYGGQQSQPMFTGAPTGGGGSLGQLIDPQSQMQPDAVYRNSTAGIPQPTAGVPQTGIQPMESQQMMTGAPTGGGGALGQLANTQPQQIQNPANAQRVAGMLRGAGRMFGRF